MTAKQYVTTAKAILDALDTSDVFDTAGEFNDNYAAYAALAAKVETALKADGLVVPDKVDKLVKLLPLILEMV